MVAQPTAIDEPNRLCVMTKSDSRYMRAHLPRHETIAPILLMRVI
jgi:hypothetical protein